MTAQKRIIEKGLNLILLQIIKEKIIDLGYRSYLVRFILKFLPIPYSTRVYLELVDRSEYGFVALNAARLAQRLNISHISLIEFGVAGGNGMVSFEKHAREVSKITGVEITIYGFDISTGLPPPIDFRDLPYIWSTNFYKMDVPKLVRKLQKSHLVIGDVKSTVETFFYNFSPPPIGGIIFDLDLYHSTKNALEILKSSPENFLPRVFCYFDDIYGGEEHLFSDFTGARLAIAEHTLKHVHMPITEIYLAKKNLPTFIKSIRIIHFFKHKRYNENFSNLYQGLPLH